MASVSGNPANRTDPESSTSAGRATSIARLDDHGAQGFRRHGTACGIGRSEALEEVVEGADRATEQCRAFAGASSPPLDAVDVSPVGNDQERLVVDPREIPLEQERDLDGCSPAP